MTLDEAMAISERRLPGESAGDELENWRASRPAPEPPKRARGLDTAQVDWAAVIRGALKAERATMVEIVGAGLGQVRNEMLDEVEGMIAQAVDQLRTELRAEFAGQLAQLRNQNDTLGGELKAQLEAIIARKRRASKAAKANGSRLLLPGPNGNGDARQQ